MRTLLRCLALPCACWPNVGLTQLLCPQFLFRPSSPFAAPAGARWTDATRANWRSLEVFRGTHPADADRIEYLLHCRFVGKSYADQRLWSKLGAGTCGYRYSPMCVHSAPATDASADRRCLTDASFLAF